MESLVTVRIYTYAHDAEIAKSLLSSHDIYCFLKDGLTIQANPFLSNALGGVKLQVRESDYETALEMLQETSDRKAEDQETIVIRNTTGELAICPSCGAEELSVVRRPSRTLFGLGFLLLGFPLPFYSTVYHCYECGRDIKAVREEGKTG
jgi:hypothetical protein